MLKRHNPPTVFKPKSRFSLAVEAPAGWRWLYISGQVGVDASGKLAAGFRGQADQTFANVKALLAAGGMGVGDLVKITVLITRPTDVADFRAARDAAFAGAEPAAATLMVVSGLADPEWMIEVEAVAAAPA